MPPFVSRKRRSASPPTDEPPTKRSASKKLTRVNGASFVELAHSGPKKQSVEETKAALEAMATADSSGESSNSDQDEFEDVPIAQQVKDSDEEMEWEDAMTGDANASAENPSSHAGPSGDLELTLSRVDAIPNYVPKSGGKKGPTKIERAIRTNTHCLHVLGLMWHNTLRNSWLNDKEVQRILVDGLSEGLRSEIVRWRTASGLEDTKDEESKPKRGRRKGKGKVKAPSKEKHRDWGDEAERQEPGIPDMSAGDPIFRLLKHLTAYWKQRFNITAPGLRKRGYLPVIEIQRELEAWKENSSGDARRFGESILNLGEFRNAAKQMTGSRDVEAQLFTALLRGLGIDARLVGSLQPAGFGWSQAEEGKKPKVAASEPTTPKKTVQIIDLDDDSELSDVPSTYSDSDIEIIEVTTPQKNSREKFDQDLPFPVYWTEALSPITNTYIPVSTRIAPKIVANAEHLQLFEPRSAAAEKAKQVICYVIAHSADGTAKDVTVRYLRKHQLPGKTKGFRLPPEKIPVYNRKGKVVKHVEIDWFKRVMSVYTRPSSKRSVADDIEDQGDLVPVAPSKSIGKGGMPDTLQGYKQSTEFVLERHLRREEAIIPTAKPIKQFTTGKGEKAKSEPVYRRKDVVSCKTVESWHKEGRQVREGQHPLKLVPIRAVTLVRKLEVEQAARTTGEKPLQGLYSRAQTEWIIPPPIQDGKIPKNAYGNIDIYVPSMIPRGAVHIPWGGTVKVCKKLGIDYAEACTGFEFGHNMAVPVISGVVVAEENEILVIEAWEEEEERKRLREDEKREKKLLGLWRKFALGLRIMERVQADYGVQSGEVPDDINPFTKRKNRTAQTTHHPVYDAPYHDDGDVSREQQGDEETYGGGFLPEGIELIEARPSNPQKEANNGLTIEGDETELQKRTRNKAASNAKLAPTSLREAHREESVEHLSSHGPRSTNDPDQMGDDSEDFQEDDSADEEYSAFSAPKSNKRAPSTRAKRKQPRK